MCLLLQLPPFVSVEFFSYLSRLLFPISFKHTSFSLLSFLPLVFVLYVYPSNAIKWVYMSRSVCVRVYVLFCMICGAVYFLSIIYLFELSGENAWTCFLLLSSMLVYIAYQHTVRSFVTHLSSVCYFVICQSEWVRVGVCVPVLYVYMA